MKEQKKLFLKLRKRKIASLRLANILGASQKESDNNTCESNTNTLSDFCPPKTYTCPPEVTN